MKKRTEVIVGAVILLSIALVVFGTIWLKGSGFGREEVVVRAQFREVGHLLVGNAVKLRGVPIGRVSRIELEPGGEGVIVSMRIRRDAPLPQDPVVLLSPESMFGDWQVEIHPRSRFPRYPFAESPDPKVLPGHSLPDMSRLTAVADEIAQNLAVLTDRVELAFTEETALNVRKAIENIQEVSEKLTGLVGSQQRAIEGVATNLEETTETLGIAAEMVRRTFAQVEASIANGELTAIVGNVERSTMHLDSLTATLLDASQALHTAVAQADTAFRSVGAIVTQVERGEGSLGRLVQDTALYSDLVRTNALVQEILEDFKANPKKYIRLRIF